jgi:putative oxidoreductase
MTSLGATMKFMNSLRPLGLLVLRLALALIFIYHGYPKLVHADAGMREFFVQHGLPAYFVSVAGILECFGALLLFLGLFTRPAALLLAGEMAVAIWKVHGSLGALVVKEYEFPLIVATACFALATTGAGAVSFDHLFLGEASGRKHHSSSKVKY